jgi:type VI secretion system protein ImpE
MVTMNAKECYEAGKLQDAITAASAEVRQHPADTGRRGFLCELLCFAGDLDRADRQLEALGHQDPQTMMGIGLFRHLVRAETARQQFYSEGRVPELLGQPSATLKLHLEASIHLREGRTTEAAQLLAQAEEQRPRVSGTCNGKAFDDLRDIDDLTAPILEVLTSNGKYYWVGIDQVDLIEFRPPARPRDLFWQRAHMIVHEGPDGEVYLPTLYVGSHADADDRVKLGRATEWRGGNGGPVRGIGQRTFLVGDESMAILELQELTFNRGPGETVG